MSANVNNNAGIYVHVPFCENKCPYCDFYSLKTNAYDPARFVDAVIMETKQKEGFGKFEYDSIYIGGGTPSVLAPDQIKAIIDNLHLSFRFGVDIEVTIECNPFSLDFVKAREYLNSGINRISLGIQSLCDKNLKILGRLHNSDMAIKSFNVLRDAGFENISVDLIYGIPGQSVEEWLIDLDKTIKLDPEHISAYNLIIENNTEFGRLYNEGKLELPSEENQRLMYDLLGEKLQGTGYNRYEISNFSKKGYESRHNLKYWTGKPYLGLGPSAVSSDTQFRIKNHANLFEYLKQINKGLAPPSETEEIGREKAIKERIMMGLRLSAGLSLRNLKDDLDYDLAKEKHEIIQSLLSEKLIEAHNDRIKLTQKSLFISDAVIIKLI